MRTIRSIAAVILAVTLCLPALANDESDKLIKEGEALYTQKEWKEALAVFERALKADAASAKAQAMIAACLGQLGDDKGAFAAYEKALKLDDPPGRVTVWVHTQKGLYYGAKNELGMSVAEFKKALEYDPNDDYVLRNLGVTYTRLKKWKEAVECFEKSLEANPDQPQMKGWIAEARRQGGLPEPKNEPRKEKPEPGARSNDPSKGLAPAGDASFELPSAGGCVTTSDLRTLVVAVPSRAELAFYDTIKLKETKRASLDFQPSQLALQGKTIFATARGGSQVFPVDLDTGKAGKPIKVPGDPVSAIACNKTKGPIFVANTKDEVFSIDAKTGAVTKTDVKGQLLAVDPVAGSFLYVASAPAETDATGKTPLKKYAIKGKDLSCVATQKSAALQGRALHVSPDGKRIVVAGAGGYQADGSDAKAGTVAVLSTEDLVTALGQVETASAPESIAFHPALAAGVALGAEGDLVQFHGRSLVPVKTTKVEAARGKECGWVAFVSRGARVALWRPGDSASKESGRLYFFSLDLTADEKAALDKAFGPEPK